MSEPETSTPCGAAVGSSALLCLVVDARVRYWEDAEINGVSTEEGDLIPFKAGASWTPVIELATGRIRGWPKGTTADIHFKVCDDGDYWLASSEGDRVAKWRGSYVPDSILCVGERGYGDYIIMKVDAAGMIKGWAAPEIDFREWDILGHNAEVCQPSENQTS